MPEEREYVSGPVVSRAGKGLDMPGVKVAFGLKRPRNAGVNSDRDGADLLPIAAESVRNPQVGVVERQDMAQRLLG